MTAGLTRTYHVKRLASFRADWMNNVPSAAVDCFPWGALPADDYRPVTVARVAHNGASLFVFMETDETNLRAETKEFGHVHTDSCMEFFLAPDPGNPRKYLNWEFNPAGGMYLAIGTSRFDRSALHEKNYRELFQVKTNAYAKGWNLEFNIPLTFLRRFFPSLEFTPGNVMRGNFYKCGDNTARPHFGCWSPIDLPKPDFHCPDFFGALAIE
jgi:hypothetical protein